MSRLQAKRTPVYRGWRRALYSYPALVVILILAILVGMASLRAYSRWSLSKDVRNQAQAKLDATEARGERLKEDVVKLKTERGWEEQVREDLKMGLPGEGLILIVDEQATST